MGPQALRGASSYLRSYWPCGQYGGALPLWNLALVLLAESLVLALDESFEPRVVLAGAPHGTAPKVFGRNIANPITMILAAAAILSYLPRPL